MQVNPNMILFVKNLLTENLPKKYFYHSLQHTEHVVAKCKLIGEYSKLSAHEMYLLETAAWWHDAGFIHVYLAHEEESCRLAQLHLPQYNYSQDEIQIIFGLIMATKIPQSPKTPLEEIIADADLLYLGTDKVYSIANKLYKELHSIQPHLDHHEWLQIQIRFLEKHHYYTSYCQLHFESNKTDYLNALITELNNLSKVQN